MHVEGRLDEAAAVLHARLGAVPNDPEALHLLGLGADAGGDPARAARLIARALSVTETARYRCNLGMALLHAGQAEEARAACARALQLRPDYPEALINLGAALEALGRPGEAAEAFRRATGLQPGRPEAWLNLGNALRHGGDAAGSEAAYRQAVMLGPTPAAGGAGPQAWLNLSAALRQLDRMEEAEAACRQALLAAPNHVDALGSLGSLLGETGRLGEAETLQRRALALKPGHVAAYNDLALTLAAGGRWHEALAVIDLAIALDARDADTRQHRAFVLLLLGRLREGWEEYEARFRTRQGRGEERGFARPAWTGAALAGRTILLHAEQGFGDTIQFCRYVPLVAARGGRVVLEVQPPLKPLLRSLPGVAQIVARGEALPAFDLHCPLLSLPLAFGTTLDSIPPPARLAVTAGAAARWLVRLPERGVRRVGVAWAGNPRHVQDRRRSVPFAALAPLWELPGVSWHSLQVGPRASDLEAAPPGVVDDLAPELADFEDTAAAMLRMDAVVTPDTAVAHLAGSLGVPALVLLPHAPDWRWLRDRADSPWYPGLRLVRQATPLGWAATVGAAAAGLRDLLRGG